MALRARVGLRLRVDIIDLLQRVPYGTVGGINISTYRISFLVNRLSNSYSCLTHLAVKTKFKARPDEQIVKRNSKWQY